MLPRATPAVCLLVLALAGAGCGDDGDAEALTPSSFAAVVSAELTEAGLESGTDTGAGLPAFRGPNSVVLDLDDAYARYQASPGERDDIVAGLVAEAEERLDEGIARLSLDDVRDDLMPRLEAPFELRTYGFEPAQTPFPGRLRVVYAVDREDSFTLVTPADVERWGTPIEDLYELALANLERQTDEETPLLCEPAEGGQLCGWASGDGYDATRMIVPGLREQIVREYGGPAVYAVPMEHVFVALPLELFRGRTEERFRLQVRRDFQTGENSLSPEVFVERDGELEVSP